MRRVPEQIIAMGVNKIGALLNTGEIMVYVEEKGKGRWGLIEPIPQEKTDASGVRAKLTPIYWVLARKTIFGHSYFTGKSWSDNPNLAQLLSPQRATGQAELIKGTVPMLHSEALAGWHAIIGPRKKPRRRK